MSPRSPTLNRKNAFSLIEVLVALAIAAVGLVAILELQRQLVDGQRRYEETLARTELRRTALEFVREINPTERPNGTIHPAPNIDISWTAQPVSTERPNTNLGSGKGNFMVQLFELDVRVTDRRTSRTQAFRVERVGWRSLTVGLPAF